MMHVSTCHWEQMRIAGLIYLDLSHTVEKIFRSKIVKKIGLGLFENISIDGFGIKT